MTDLAKLKTLTGETDEILLGVLLEDAEEFVLAYTNRTQLPDILKRTVRELALYAYNRLGTEGESSRSEGGESYRFDNAPKAVFDVLNRYRLARVGGYAFEKKQAEDLQPQEEVNTEG